VIQELEAVDLDNSVKKLYRKVRSGKSSSRAVNEGFSENCLIFLIEY